MLEIAETGSSLSKSEFEERVPGLRVELVNLQEDHRHADFPVVVVLAGDDRVGVRDVLRRLGEWMDTRFLPMHVVAEDDPIAARYPYTWPFWQALPGRGEMALYVGRTGSRAIRDRLDGALDDARFAVATERIRRLEETLVADGAVVVKIWLHLPRKQARARLKKGGNGKRADAWRLSEAEWGLYERYDDAMLVVERYLELTSHPGASWHVIESTDSRHRDTAVAETLLAAVRSRLDGSSGPPSPPSTEPAVLPGAGTTGLLETVDLDSRLDYDVYRKRLEKMQDRLHELEVAARSEGISTMLVFEGWDAAGKGGVIRRVTQALEPGDFTVFPIGVPNQVELDHHYLWRFWTRLEPSGQVQIFDRSWYGRVLVERVEGLASAVEWGRAYREINDFEDRLAEGGTVLAKFWLHIDPDEQLRRFRAREQTPYKKYKITDEDYRNRARWNDYAVAAEEMFARTSTSGAPWHLVAANDKRWARVHVLTTVCEALARRLDG